MKQKIKWNLTQSKPMKKNKTNIYLSALLIILTLIIITQNLGTQETLGNILKSLYTPKAYLTLSQECKILSGTDANELFGLNLSNNLFYVEEITITIQNKIDSNVWVKIFLPESLNNIDILSEPKAEFEKTEQELNYQPYDIVNELSAIWSQTFTPGDVIRIMIFYEKDSTDELKKSRTIQYGSQETGQNYRTINCYGLTEIYQ